MNTRHHGASQTDAAMDTIGPDLNISSRDRSSGSDPSFPSHSASVDASARLSAFTATRLSMTERAPSTMPWQTTMRLITSTSSTSVETLPLVSTRSNTCIENIGRARENRLMNTVSVSNVITLPAERY